MTDSLPHRLPLVPRLLRFLGRPTMQRLGTEEEQRELRVYRLLCLLAAVLMLAFGVAYQWSDTTAQDPLLYRVLLAGMALSIIGSSYGHAKVRQHFGFLVLMLLYVTTIHFIHVAALNNFAPQYTVGLLFAVPGLGVGYSASLRRITPLIWYFIFTVVLASMACYTLPNPETAPAVFIGSLSSISLAVFMVANAWIDAQKNYRASQERYQAVVEQASDGIYLLDAETLRFLDANPAYLEMSGYRREELLGLTVQDLVVDELETAVDAGLSDSEEHAHLTGWRLRRKDGSEIFVDFRIDHIRYEGREVLSVVVHDITQRRQFEERLIAAKERAEEIARFKTTLLTNMNHEIRTPLSGILGCTAVLKEEVPTEQRELVELIEESGKRLFGNLDAVLELATLDANSKQLALTTLDVEREVEMAVAPWRQQAEAAGLSFLIEKPETPFHIQFDASILRRILNHLLDNALKFTRRGHIAVRLAAVGDDFRLRVDDTGVGISDDFLPYVFEEFKQESEGASRHYEGNGLGLAITRRLVQLHGGEIRVESWKGRGTTFIATFPDAICTPEAQAPLASPLQQILLSAQG